MDASAVFIVGALALGAILGSFLNALSFRYRTGISILHGRSRCMRCGHTLSPLDLVPVVSWLLLCGRCRYCGARISVQYPLVETTAALLSLGVYLTNPGALGYTLSLLLWLTILFIVVYDVRHTVIPWSASLLLVLLMLVFLLEMGSGAVLPHLIAGVCLALPLWLLSALSRGRAMGWGDGGFEFSLGALLGATAGLTALMLGIWSGALVGIGLLLSRRGVTMKSEIPLAPYLALGAAIAYFFHVDLFLTLPTLW